VFNEWSAKDENKGDDKGYSEKACKVAWENISDWYDEKADNKVTIGSLIFEA
jgi:cation transport regulator ChaB